MLISSISWTLAGVAALPFAFLTSIYYVDYSATAPYIWTENSTCPKIVESSGCSLVDTRVRVLIYLLLILKRPSKWGVILFVYNLSHWNPIFPLQENQILNNSNWKIKKAFSFLFFSVSYVEPEGNEKMRKILPIWSSPSFFLAAKNRSNPFTASFHV